MKTESAWAEAKNGATSIYGWSIEVKRTVWTKQFSSSIVYAEKKLKSFDFPDPFQA
jgi:hypothetical protein